MNHPDYSLYLITDESIPLEKLLFIVEEAVKGGTSIVQLREKKCTGKHFYEKALQLKELLRRYQVPLIINDRVDIALAVRADGIHIGQDDLPVAAVRKIVPETMIVGTSVSNVEEAVKAEKNGADYIGVGTVFPTPTKSDARILPNGMLERVAGSVSIPAVAIGGIHPGNVEKVLHSGISGIAVVSSIMKAESPKLAAQSLRKKVSVLRKP